MQEIIDTLRVTKLNGLNMTELITSANNLGDIGETWQRRRVVQQFYAKMDKSRDFVLKSEAIWSFRLPVKHSSSTSFQSIFLS